MGSRRSEEWVGGGDRSPVRQLLDHPVVEGDTLLGRFDHQPRVQHRRGSDDEVAAVVPVGERWRRVGVVPLVLREDGGDSLRDQRDRLQGDRCMKFFQRKLEADADVVADDSSPGVSHHPV